MAFFGPHVSREHATGKRPSMAAHVRVAAAEAAREGFDMKAASVFVANPRALTMVFTESEAEELRSYVAGAKIRIIAHSSYVAVPWGGNPYAAIFIRSETMMCEKAGIEGLVVHLPNRPPDAVVKFLPRLWSKANGVRLYLETPAVSPQKSQYETPEKLCHLFKEIRAKVDRSLSWTGLCIDTAHLWSCGVDISSRESAEEWLEALDACSDIIPSDRIMFHLNDSERKCGDGSDKHATLMEGKIWEEYKDSPEKSGLSAFVDYAVKHGNPTILERKPESALLKDYRTLYALNPAVRLPEAD